MNGDDDDDDDDFARVAQTLSCVLGGWVVLPLGPFLISSRVCNGSADRSRVQSC